jgi:hypothetical protein
MSNLARVLYDLFLYNEKDSLTHFQIKVQYKSVIIICL